MNTLHVEIGNKNVSVKFRAFSKFYVVDSANKLKNHLPDAAKGMLFYVYWSQNKRPPVAIGLFKAKKVRGTHDVWNWSDFISTIKFPMK